MYEERVHMTTIVTK